MQTRPLCPRCKRQDCQALPALHLNRLLPASFYDSEGNLQTINMTSELHQLLVPPREPRKPGGAGCVPLAGMVGILFILIIVTLCGIYLTISGGMLFNRPDIAAGLSRDSEPGVVSTAFGLLALMGIVLILLGGAGAIFIFRRVSRVYKNAQETAEKRYALQQPIYDRAKLWWENCYYCHVDGIVFDGNNSWHPQQFKQVLDNIYSNSQP